MSDEREEARKTIKLQLNSTFVQNTKKKKEIKEVKRPIKVDHVVITQFRNDSKQPTLFANAKGEFISVANKDAFNKANKTGKLKLSMKDVVKVVNKLPKDAKSIEISPAFTLEQFKAFIAD